MKKFLLAVLGLIAFAVSVVGIWIQFPQLHHPQVTEEAIRAALEREGARQSQANEPDLNAYLNPIFLPFWGAPWDRAPNPIESTMTTWREYSTSSQGELVKHGDLLTNSDYLKARASFESLVPELTEALKRENFVVRGRIFDFITDSSPHLVNIRGLVLGLSALSESYQAEKRTNEAVLPLVLSLRLSGAIDKEPGLFMSMLGVAFDRIAVDTALGIFTPASQLEASQWDSLSQACLANLSSDHQLESVLEDELAVASNTFEKINSNPSLRSSFIMGGALYSIPGMLAREERIYFNQMTGDLINARQGNLATLPAGWNFKSWLQGSGGVLADNMSWIDQQRLKGLLDSRDALLLGFGVSSSLLAERTRSGDFPADLANLKVPIEGLTWVPESQTLTVKTGQYVQSTDLNFEEHFGPSSWVKAAKDSLVFDLGAR